MPVTAPYGSWKSPITTSLIVSGAVGLGQIALDGEDVYWVEMRPSEGGRMVVVRRGPDGNTEDVTPSPYSCRTRVHEYGGGAFVVADGSGVLLQLCRPALVSAGAGRPTRGDYSRGAPALRRWNVRRPTRAHNLCPRGPFRRGRAGKRHCGGRCQWRGTPAGPLLRLGLLRRSPA